jgi:hypothetical protein
MKLRVMKFYRGWASGEDPWEEGDVVNVSDAVRDLPSPDAPDDQWRGSLAEYLLKTYPDRFVEVKPRRRKVAAKEE